MTIVGTSAINFEAFTSTDLYTSSFIVGDLNEGANYTSLTAALAASSPNGVIFIKAQTLVEDVNIDKKITIVGYNDSNFDNGPTIISGKITLAAGIACKFSNLTLTTNGDNLLESTSAGGFFFLSNCRLNVESGRTCVNITDSAGPAVYIHRCYIVGNTSSVFVNNAASTAMFVEYSTISGMTTATSTISAGSVNIRFCICLSIFTTSSTGRVLFSDSTFGVQVTPYLNVTFLTTAGTDRDWETNIY